MSEEQRAPSAAVAEGVAAGARWITVPRERIRETLLELKAEGYLSYAFMTCVDHLATPALQRVPLREGVTLPRGALAELLRQGPEVGIHAIWVGAHGHALPGECGAVTTLTGSLPVPARQVLPC